MVAFIDDESRREEITALASRRFSYMKQGEQLIIGNADGAHPHFAGLEARGRTVLRLVHRLRGAGHPFGFRAGRHPGADLDIPRL